MKLRDRVAVVTGGVSGIGRAISKALGQEGAIIVANYSRSEEEAQTTSRQLQEAGIRHMLARADVSVEAEVTSMLDRVVSEFGRVDVLVNNAATTAYASFLDTDLETWERIMAVNLRGPFLCTKHFGRAMQQQGGGSIINIGSRAAYVSGSASSTPYCVSKAGLVMLTRCAASALAPIVRVNTVAAGFTPTTWYEKHGSDLAHEIEVAVAMTPLRRTTRPEDVAAAVLFLVSDDAGFITGQTLLVDGGRFMH